MAIYDRIIDGTNGDDVLSGGNGDDLIRSTGGHDDVFAGNGNDHVIVRGTGGHLIGGAGHDLIEVSRSGTGQYHVYGASGDDTLRMDLATDRDWKQDRFLLPHEAYHAYGGYGRDTFAFHNVRGAEADTMCRLDDFNPTVDRLVIDGRAIDFGDLPAGLRLVSFLGQQWLHINNDPSQGNTDPTRGDVLIGLNGPRQLPNAEETHFPTFPVNADALPSVSLIDENYVQRHLYAAREGALNVIVSMDASVTGTGAADHIYASKDNNAPVGLVSTISGLGGNDVIEVGSGHDTVLGGDGDDLISGGLDNDRLFGGSGRDWLFGGSERDRLEGQGGNDRLVGGTDKDILTGGGGADDFVFANIRDSGPGKAGRDIIQDFGGRDDIVLRQIDAVVGRAGNQDFRLDTNGGFDAGEIRVREVKAGVLVHLNVDADAKAELSILVRGVDSLGPGDFVF